LSSFLGAFAKLRKRLSFIMSVRLSVRLRGTTRFPLDGFSWNLIFEGVSKICRDNSRFIKIGQEYWVLYMKTNIYIFIILWSFLLRMRTVSDKSCRENQNKHFVLSKFLFLENPAVYEIMWRNTVERGRPQTTVSRMNIACWIPKTTRIHTGCEILIAFLLQQCLLDWASKLHYAQIVCLVPYGAHEGDERNCISMQCNSFIH
jgi:hypothetical protein